jgi:hypothetical protein
MSSISQYSESEFDKMDATPLVLGVSHSFSGRDIRDYKEFENDWIVHASIEDKWHEDDGEDDLGEQNEFRRELRSMSEGGLSAGAVPADEDFVDTSDGEDESDDEDDDDDDEL